MSAPLLPVTLGDIEAAARRIEGQVLRTPFLEAPRLSEFTGARIFVKYENLQATSSFKDRGALNKLLGLSEAERSRGVIAMSAGNHAQAVAYHARRLGAPATIVMPETTPFVKVANTEGFGARVVLAGETIADARPTMETIAAREGLTLIHPYDDPLIIAGQGTIGLEIADDLERNDLSLDVMVVPVGGGGLIAGIAVALAARRAEVEVLGVEAALYPSMHCALHGLEAPIGGATLAEGIAVKVPGIHTLPIIKAHVADMLLADEHAIECAVAAFLSVQKTMAEGAGAAPLAAVLADPARFRGRSIALILSGGNIDPRMLASVTVRSLERDGKIVALRLTTEDRPGVLGHIATLLGRSGANILEVSHRRMLLDVPAKGASVDLLIEVKNAAHAAEVEAALAADGLKARRLKAGDGGDVLTG